MQHHVEIHSAWISCRLTTVCPTVVWHLSASEVLSKSWKRSTQRRLRTCRPASSNEYMEHHAFRFTALNLILLGNVSEVVIVKSYAPTCTLRLQRLLPDPDTDISMMISKIWYNDCSSHIGLVPKPKKHVDTRRSTYAKLCTSCLC